MSTAKPLTYAAFLRESKKRQRQYIKREQERIAAAGRLFALYQSAMLGLALHPLTGGEISERTSQLLTMLAEIDETHGDTEGQRAAYDLRVAAGATWSAA